jgi:tetratricopeptide (TPR) repeat protein
MGIAHWKMGNPDLAKETLRQVPIGTPSSVEALRCLVAIALEQQDFKLASTLHKQLRELGEPSPELLYNTGLLLQKLGSTPEAADYYRQALTCRPDFPQAQLNLGHALMALGKPDEAHASWQAALRGHVELAEHFLV